MDKKQKKKVQVYKKFVLCFPFTFQYRIITGEGLSNLLKMIKLVYEFNSETKRSIKFGYNSSMKLIQEEKLNQSENDGHLIFFFYKQNLQTLINLLIMKGKNNIGNNKLFLICEEEKEHFKKLLKIKNVICFTLVKNEKNEKVFKGICTTYEQYDCISPNNLVSIYQSDVKEISNEK